MPTLNVGIDASRAASGASQFASSAKKVGASSTAAARNVDKLNQKLDKSKTATSLVGSAFKSFAITMVAVTGIKNLVSTIGDFEQTMTQVKGVTGATEA